MTELRLAKRTTLLIYSSLSKRFHRWTREYYLSEHTSEPVFNRPSTKFEFSPVGFPGSPLVKHRLPRDIVSKLINFTHKLCLIKVVPQKMTLQLVLPNQSVSDDPNGYDISGVQYRRSRPASRTGSVIESKSPGFINTRLVNYNRGVSYQPSMLSHSHSQFHIEPENIPPPSTNEEKSKHTR